MAAVEQEVTRGDRSRRGTPLGFVLKVASRCNLDCTYCYMYNKGDDTWRKKPAFMSDEVLQASLGRIRDWCESSGQTHVDITFHGGEPMLVGPTRFAELCRTILTQLEDINVSLIVQTNGVLVDAEWTDVLRGFSVRVGVSIDGTEAVHDANRVDFAGRGSHAKVVKGIRMLLDAGIDVGSLSVIQFGADPVEMHHYLTGLGLSNVNYLLPDFTHDTIDSVHAQYGLTPCADFLIPLFDHWWNYNTLDVHIPLFTAISRLVLGGPSTMDLLGNQPFGFVFIDTDGEIEDLDVLRVCRSGMAAGGVNVLTDAIGAIADMSDLHRAAIFDGVPLPTACRGCAEQTTCAGGYLPHRWSRARQFDNASVWCADLLAIFAHVRKRLEVEVEETELRRLALHTMAPVDEHLVPISVLPR